MVLPLYGTSTSITCNRCGEELAKVQYYCRKCSRPVVCERFILEVDVSGRERDWERVRSEIEEALITALCVRANGIKVIHADGSAKGRPNPIGIHSRRHLRRKAADLRWRLLKDRQSENAHVLFFNR